MKEPRSDFSEMPFVSVVMPIRNEADYLVRSLGSVLAQNYPHDRLEVILADGMSTDATHTIIASMRNLTDISVITVVNPGMIAASGLNTALRRAKGSIIVRVDGHCEIAPDYVSRCVHYILEGQADAVGGPIETIGDTPVSKAIALAMSSTFGVGDSAFRTVSDQTLLVDTVAFPAYTREAIEAAGPFDEELVRNQDDEYSYRLRRMGFRILLAKDITSRYYSRSTIKSLAKQYFQYGYWKVRVMQKHSRQMRPRQFAPPVFVGSLIAASALSPVARSARFALKALAALYVCANAAATLITLREKGPAYAKYMPLVFATLHVSYGLGFLVGILRFSSRWFSNQSKDTAHNG